VLMGIAITLNPFGRRRPFLLRDTCRRGF